jgi:serine protease Do
VNKLQLSDRKIPRASSWPLVVGLLLSVVSPPAFAGDKPPQAPPEEALRYANALSTAFGYAAETISPSVVTIRVVKHFKAAARGGNGAGLPQLPEGLPFDNDLLRRFFGDRFQNQLPPQEGMGSGVIVSADGYILTNNHVVGDADEVTVTLHDDRELHAEVVGRDPLSDLAVIRVKAHDLPSAKLGNSEDIKVGEWVVAAGNPFGLLSDSITAGIVSAKGRSNVRIVEYADFIQTDAAINPGNSGGPLVNLRGEVIGINTAIISRGGGNNGVGLAIPISMAKSVMESLISKGHVTRGWLGVGIQPLNEDMAHSFGYDSTEGVLIGNVIKNGPADEAGLKQGDIVTAFDGTKIKDTQQFRNLVAAAEPGNKAKLEVLRDGAKKSISVKLALRSEDEEVAAAGQGDANELGLTVTNLTPEARRALGLDRDVEGVAITQVDPDSAAYRAGLREGQLVLDVQGTPVNSVAEFRTQVAKHDLKKGIRLRVQVGEQQVFVLLRSQE